MRQSRVLIDGYFLDKPYGFGRFISELCRALGTFPHELDIVVAVPDRVDPALLPRYDNLAWHTARDMNFALWEQWVMPRLARHLGCGLIHFPYNTRALFAGRVCTVTTVHDVIFLSDKVSWQLKPWAVSAYSKYVFRWATHRSDAVVSVSNTTRQALASLGICATTVYNTVDGFLTLRPPKPEAPQRPYLFHRGGYAPHRNTERVIRAFDRVRRRLPNVDLWIAGAPDGAKLWGTSGDNAVRYLPRLSDLELAECYAQSACVIATSLREGFGLPIIEAFGFGAPVITSDVDPMREIAGDAALLIEPTDLSALETAIVSVMTMPSMAGTLVRKGYERVKTFANEHVAEQMQLIYKECLNNAGAKR